MDLGFWLVMLFFAGILIFVNVALYLASIKKLSTEERKAGREEMEQFSKKHPVWTFFYTYLPFPLVLILQLVGPKLPKIPTKDE